MWSNLQIIASISWALEISFPTPFPEFLRLLSFLQPTELLSSIGCADDWFSTYSASMVMSSVIPLGVAIVIWTAYFIRIWCIGWRYEWIHRSRENSKAEMEMVENPEAEHQVIVMPSIEAHGHAPKKAGTHNLKSQQQAAKDEGFLSQESWSRSLRLGGTGEEMDNVSEHSTTPSQKEVLEIEDKVYAEHMQLFLILT